jgi:tRNA threonylcarbamoyladenosine biosynthesis protein TsaB
MSMKILAIDTATEACSVALLVNETYSDVGEMKADSDIHSIFEICPQQHSQQILPMIDTLLSKRDLEPKQLSAIAFGCGPGSFTGVRIAASTVQGLAFGANLPVVQVSTLATMAQEVYALTGATEQLVLIDARMKEVYMGHFKIIDGLAIAQADEVVVAPELALEYAQKLNADIGFAGTGFISYAELFADILNGYALDVHYPNAKYMLPFAESALQNNTVISVEQIHAVYVRDTVTWEKLPHKR